MPDKIQFRNGLALFIGNRATTDPDCCCGPCRISGDMLVATITDILADESPFTGVNGVFTFPFLFGTGQTLVGSALVGGVEFDVYVQVNCTGDTPETETFHVEVATFVTGASPHRFFFSGSFSREAFGEALESSIVCGSGFGGCSGTITITLPPPP